MANHYSNILRKLEEEYRAVERYYGQTVYKLSKDGFAYLRYSKREKTGKEKYFFGLDKDAIEKLNKDFVLSIIDGLKISGSRWLINIYKAKNVWYLKVSGNGTAKQSWRRDI
jgi:hypothetical protein